MRNRSMRQGLALLTAAMVVAVTAPAASALARQPAEVDLTVAVWQPSGSVTATGGHYLVEVTNLGSVTVDGPISLRSSQTGFLTLAGFAGQGWSCHTGDQPVKCTFSGSLDPGSSTRLTISFGYRDGPRNSASITVRVGHRDDGYNPNDEANLKLDLTFNDGDDGSPPDNPPGDDPPGDDEGDPPGDDPPGDDPPGDDPPGDDEGDPPGDEEAGPPGDDEADPPGGDEADPPGDDPPGDDPPGDDPPGDDPPGDDEGDPPGDDEADPPGDDEGDPPGDDEGGPPGHDEGDPPGDDEGDPPGDDEADPPGDDEGDPPGDDAESGPLQDDGAPAGGDRRTPSAASPTPLGRLTPGVPSALEPELVTASVAPSNDPPVAAHLRVTTDEGTPVLIDLLEASSDPNGDPLHVAWVTSGEHGRVLIDPRGRITYVPRVNFSGSDIVTFQVCDPSGACDVGTVVVDVTALNDLLLAAGPTSFSNPTSEPSPQTGGGNTAPALITVFVTQTVQHLALLALLSLLVMGAVLLAPFTKIREPIFPRARGEVSAGDDS